MIRKADIGDIPQIRQMAEVIFRQTYREILSTEQMEYMMDWMYSEESLRRQMTEGHQFFLEDGCGYASFRPDGKTADDRPRYHLEKLYVMSSVQKTGLGRRLFERICAEARAAAPGMPCRIEVNVNRSNPAVSFYEHIGMKRDRQGDFPIGRGFYMNDFIYALDL